jgi:N-acetylneuraminic acid mutarotase
MDDEGKRQSHGRSDSRSGKIPEWNIVKFGDKTAILVSASPGRLVVEAPALFANTEVAVSVEVAGMEKTAPECFAFIYNWYEMSSFTAGEVFAAKGFTIGNKGYLFGGFLYNPDIASNPRLTFRLWEYDMDGNSWSEKQKAPDDIITCIFSCSYGNKGYIISQNETKDMYEYDPATNNWTVVSRYPGQSHNLTGFVIGDELYTGLGTDYYLYYNEFYRYSFASKTWTRLNDFPGMPRDGSVAFTLNGKGYMATGRNYMHGRYLADLWEYDPDLDQWSAKAAFPGAGRYMATAFTMGGKAYVGLGTREDNFSGYPDLWRYDAEKDSWERKDNYTGGGKWLNVVFSNEQRAFVGPGTRTDLNSSWMIWRGFKDIWEFVEN